MIRQDISLMLQDQINAILNAFLTQTVSQLKKMNN